MQEITYEEFKAGIDKFQRVLYRKIQEFSVILQKTPVDTIQHSVIGARMMKCVSQASANYNYWHRAAEVIVDNDTNVSFYFEDGAYFFKENNKMHPRDREDYHNDYIQ